MTNASDVESPRAGHRRICEQLNIDAATEEQSWTSYWAIRNTYNLDGDQVHWLCCSLYVTCRQTVTPTVGNTNAVLQGNCVSLTQLLRLCRISLNEFFAKIKQWVEMASLPVASRTAIDHLLHRFKVSMAIYGKYHELFKKLFWPPNVDEARRSKKSKPVPCSTKRLHEFCWTLFICAKAEYPEQSVDLVTSHYMLMCCLDMVYSNAIVDGRRDIVNPDFERLPADFVAEGRIPLEPLCIIDALCEDGDSSEAITTKNTIWKDVIEKLFQTNVLRGDANSFTGLVSVGNFDENQKSLNSLYDRLTLSCGEFDERIALGQKIVENPLASRVRTERDAPERIPLCQQTPLSGRSRISKDECSIFTPISTANASVNKLRMKLSGYDGEPHGALRELLKTCTQDPTPVVKKRIAAEREKFNKQMREQNWNQKSTTAKFDMIEALYYKLLENIIRAEIRRRGANVIAQVCCEEMFNKTLLVCSAEIVIYAHNLQQNFSWILNTFEVAPFIFYRVIEMVILNHNDLLSRDLIKHLTIIEEQCMESLSWQSSSPLWTVMENISYEVTASHGVESSTDLSGITPHKPGDSVTKANGLAKLEPVGPRTNLNLSSLGFNSPLKLPVPNGSLSKQRPGVSSLNLFFRKFYQVAAVRMKDLCINLGLTSEDKQKQIWTIFEYSIVHCTRELMRDRHLDQMLMCAIYVFVKVTKLPSSFSDIMKFYRNQPQSSSHVYRSVFIAHRNPVEQPKQQQQQEEEGTEPRVAPTDLAGVSMQHGREERGDIILFYNKVYVPLMQDFAIQFGSGDRRSLILSPPPRTPSRSVMQSPKQIDGRISLYVTPMDRRGDLKESPNSITYLFDRSPAKDLDHINRIVKNTSITGCKRSLNDPDSYEAPRALINPRRKCTKLDRLISERQQ